MAQRRLKVSIGAHLSEIDANPDERLRHFRANADQHRISAEQPRLPHNVEQSLDNLLIHQRNAADVKNETLRRRTFERVKRPIPQHAQALAIERAHQRNDQGIGADGSTGTLNP